MTLAEQVAKIEAQNKELARWNENQRQTIIGYEKETSQLGTAYSKLVNDHEALKKENLDQDLKTQIVEMQKRVELYRLQIMNQSQTIEYYQEQVDKLKQPGSPAEARTILFICCGDRCVQTEFKGFARRLQDLQILFKAFLNNYTIKIGYTTVQFITQQRLIDQPYSIPMYTYFYKVEDCGKIHLPEHLKEFLQSRTR